MMEKQLTKTAWIPLLLAFLLTHVALAKLPVRVQLMIHQIGTELWTTMTFKNQSSKPVYLNKIDIGMGNRLLNKVFIVVQEQREIPYTGVMVKRRAPTADDFVLLEPGKRVQTRIRIDQSYAFLPGRHRYTIHYQQYHSSPTDQNFILELASAGQPFTYNAVTKQANK
ncbi:hypothetical protein [Spirosoma arcticum]